MSERSSRMGLRRWIWRSYVQSALIPLVLVETVLIACYLFSNQAFREAQVDYLQRNATDSLGATAEQNARIVQNQLRHVAGLTELYGNMAARALTSESPGSAAAEPLQLTADGARYSPRDLGGAASFYSSSTAPAQQDLAKVGRLATLDALMREIKQHEPMVASIYINTWDSYNRIYPWFRTDEQYPHDMRIPQFNFYYLADAAHNPQRSVRWTDIYLDPAGHGWMMSAIAPVYRGDFLEGVVGLDVTVGKLLEEIATLKVPWGGYLMLVSNDMKIMALPPAAEHDFDLHEPSATAGQVLRAERFKSEDFDLAQRPETVGLANALKGQAHGQAELLLRGKPHLVAWSEIQPAGWRLLAVADRSEVMAETNNLAAHFRTIGYLLILGLVLFYLVFFSYMWLRASRLSERLRRPIAGIAGMLQQIGAGQWLPARVHSPILELDDMAGAVLAMGSQLASSEAQRNAAQQHLALVVESVTAGLWEYTPDDDRLRLRGEFCERFGLADSTLSRAEFMKHVEPQDVARLDAALDALRYGDCARIDLELRLLRADGTPLWLLCRGRLLASESAAGRLAAGTFVDIEPLKQVEEDLRQRTEEALAASKAKSRFISSMSHELRTPLNAIYGFGQLLRLQADDGSADAQSLDEILGASRHLTHLVDDLLDLSSLQAEKPRLQLRAVPLGELMQACAEMLRSQAEAAGLTLQVECPAQSLSARADARRLRQVVLNLLSNAIKYNRPQGLLLLGCEVLGERVRLFVEDGGQGIAESLQASLFQPFQRLGRENSAIQGTGIGLALCQELAGLMEGSMGLRSAPGVGSRFWIELALAGAPEAAGGVDRGLPRLFVLSRDETLLASLGSLAERLALSGGDLPACLAEARTRGLPALLLVDCDSLGEALTPCLQRLRRLPGGESLPVIVLSASPRELAMLGCDFQAVLAQPLDLDELRVLVDALLEKEPSNVH